MLYNVFKKATLMYIPFYNFVKKITKWKAINLFYVSISYYLCQNGVVW